MTKITSGAFQKQFGLYRTMALQSPVITTHHGRDDLAVISADEYKRLKQLDQRAYYAHELPEDVIAELGTVPIPKEAKKFNDEFKP